MKKNSVKEPYSPFSLFFLSGILDFCESPPEGHGRFDNALHSRAAAKAAFCLCPAILAARKRVNVLQVCILVKYHQRTFSFETPHKLRYTYQHIDAAFTRFRLMLFVIRLPNPLPFYLLEVICRSFLFSRYNRGRFR